MMSQYYIKDFARLKKILENHRNPVLRDVYASYVGSDVTSARVNLYEHPDGCQIEGMKGRWWVYVSVRSKRGTEYDIALWKIMRHSDASDLLRNVVRNKAEDEEKEFA